MPRIRRRGFERLYSNSKLTFTQHETLMYGAPILDQSPGDGPDFSSPEEEKRAWFMHRKELLAEERRPGVRAHGFYRWELGIEPKNWVEELRPLMDRGMITDESERIAIEQQNPMLSPQPPSFLNDFDDAKLIWKRINPSEANKKAAEFDLAVMWHTWRGRPEISEQFRRRAELVRMKHENADWV